ncbi:PRTRC system protein B [Paraburkholderia tropica]|uniref:PRTRC system protein B n=1 Tax=Paraburkholderia tropica TaxID=92647 RepID=UPI001CB29299|nr:PRTRC system protein B [Paraburkholderia tropica]CAG9195735.1 PRTRC system protein B [Paraburkholderia tropica]
MNDVQIACESDTDLEIDAALLFYRARANGAVYATQHAVRVVDDRPALLPGVPLTLEALAEFADLAARRTSYRGFVHERVVYLAPNMLVWWVPACTRRVWFQHAGELGNASGDCQHPPLVFAATRGNWSVFALRDNARPDAQTALYRAPYFNVWEDGRICVGNVVTPDTLNSDSIKPYEDAFFRSRFTHANADKLIKGRGGAVRLWKQLLDGSPFPLHQLIDAKCTLADVVKTISTED